MKFSRSLSLVLFLFIAVLPLQAKDDWTQVKSRNFLLVGNASEKDIRKVATRLEQFRETFRVLFGGMKLVSPIPTNVVVFKSDSSYKNFKPKRADGSLDTEVAGFFQPGEDVNYITLSLEGEDEETFKTIFHEYVHFIINTNFGKSEVPPWFNEGLAEYYSTFAIENDSKVKLGLPHSSHIYYLRESRLMPLDQLFKVTNFQLLQTGGHSRTIFYAESWAIVHYLIQSGKSAGMHKFLAAIMDGQEQDKAFQATFGMTYLQMETALRKYVGQSQYQYNELVLGNKLNFDADMQASPLAEADTNAYLGDLLYHNNRADDAEPYLQTALKLKPDLGMANVTLGMVKMKQRKFDEARAALEKAIAGDPRNHVAFFRYAFLLSREGRDEFGFVRSFDATVAAKMREALKKAIAINPAFTESYELLAFVDVVNNEELDEAVTMMQNALKYQPGNQRYALRLAEILSRQGKLDESETMAKKISGTADDPDVRTRAANLIDYIIQKRLYDEQVAAYKHRNGGVDPQRIEAGKAPSEEELAKRQSDANLRSINASLRRPEAGEQRVIGRIQKIECRAGSIFYPVKAGEESFTLTSKDFQRVTLNAFDPGVADMNVGCSTDLSALNAVITFRPMPSGKTRGEMAAIEFVPVDFRLMSEEEARHSPVIIYQQPPPPPRRSDAGPVDIEARRRELMANSIREALQKPVEGQKRETGFLEKIECSGKAAYFHLRTPTRTLRLLAPAPGSMKIIYYTPDLSGLELGCTLEPVEFPAIFVYWDKPDQKAKTTGEIVSLEFVPKSFVLE